jgi:hypothetical protein
MRWELDRLRVSQLHEDDTDLSPSDTFRRFATEIRPLMGENEGESPLTTPEVFDSVRREYVWHSYLAYFINADEPHGFDTQFLNAFLEACDDAGVLNRAQIDGDSQPTVKSEVGTNEGRIPDILLYCPDEWFLLLELKVDSPEGDAQTSDYAVADEVGPIDVADYPENSRFYGYVAPHIPGTINETFVGVRWEDIATRFAQARNELSISDYPLRSIVQLDDFIETLETTMPQIDDETQERAELYFEYVDEIEAAEQAVTTFVKDVLQYEWTDTLTQPETSPGFWDDSWYIQAQGKTFGQFARQSWELPNGLDIHFEHHPNESHFKQGELHFRLDIEAPNSLRQQSPDPRGEFRQRFIQLVSNDNVALPESTTVDDGEGELDTYHELISAYYSYEPGDAEAYYETLAQATEDHADLVPIVDRLFETYPDL